MEMYTLVGDIVEQIEEVKSSRRYVWVRSVNPNEEEIAQLAKLTQAPVEDFKEFLEEDERPRVLVEKHLQVIYSAPIKEDGEMITIPIAFFINKNIIVTVEKKKVNVLNKIEQLIEAGKARYIFRQNTGYFLYHVLDKINDRFLANIDQISNLIDIYEQRTTLLTQSNIEKIYATSVTLSFFNRAMLANLEALSALRKTYYRPMTPKNKEKFADLYLDALQIIDTEKIQREVITNLFNMQSIMSANKLNGFMKRLTSIALIIMIPTLISGIYGMNFTNIPLKDHPNGFFIIIGAMAVIVTLALIITRWSDIV